MPIIKRTERQVLRNLNGSTTVISKTTIHDADVRPLPPRTLQDLEREVRPPHPPTRPARGS